MADTHVNFSDLAANEVEGQDFRVLVKEGRTGIVIVAPHGGKRSRLTRLKLQQRLHM
ncbi:hypothetical protein G3257_15975 [Janthinobacterium lividum]|uniref:poly-gamma-glutamate hydrolase family protein n=1 Tax=Janthinobacterium lividum TaxID=29581 RepID=UPI0015961256|nr:poly-gamma-glutamate hydrolase family protein [Janthinobacterium lividum]QKY03603.1 hypothetical protein G3257_15975 [Janthinobacterium lividum]